jgi:hypothetical protein
MISHFLFPTLISRLNRQFVSLAGVVVAVLMIATAFVAPAYAAEVPSDDEQDVMIRSTLATFNDANMTGNYSILIAKASKQFQDQMSAEKLAAGTEDFRKNHLFFENVVTDEYESSEKATIDQEGALNLAGVFKGGKMKVTYKLRFVQNANAWKLIGITVNATKI